MINETIEYRARRAARLFLEDKGYKIALDVDGECIDYVAIDDDTVVFVAVNVSNEGFEDAPERIQLERAAHSIFHKYWDLLPLPAPVRFDCVSLDCLSDSRAFLRHHVNCAGIEMGGLR